MQKNTALTSIEKARLLFEAREYEATISELTSFKNHQDDENASFLLAESLWRAGRKNEALRQFEKCFDGDKSKRDIPLHVCCLLHHETSIGKLYWSDLIYWCLSAVYCGINVEFVDGLLSKFFLNQVHHIDNQLLKNHHDCIKDVKTLTDDVRNLRRSLSTIGNSRKTKSVNIDSVQSNVKREQSTFKHIFDCSKLDYSNHYLYDLNISNFNYECNTYFYTNSLKTHSFNESGNNINWRSIYDSKKHEVKHVSKEMNISFDNTHTKMKSSHTNCCCLSRHTKKYERPRNRKVYCRKLRKNLLIILKCIGSYNILFLNSISKSNIRTIHYITYIMSIRYVDYVPNFTKRCIINNSGVEQNTNNPNFDIPSSFYISVSSQKNVKEAIDKFCTNNKVILDRLSKKSQFDTKVATFNALAKFCNDREHILERLQLRSSLNGSNLDSHVEVTFIKKEKLPTDFKNHIFVDAYSKENILEASSENNLVTNERSLKICGVETKNKNVAKTENIYKTWNKIVSSSVLKPKIREPNIFVDNFDHIHDHEIITNNEVTHVSQNTNNLLSKTECKLTDGNANNVILDHNMFEPTEMISYRDLESKQTSTNNITNTSCVKQKNIAITKFIQKENMGIYTDSYANEVLGTSTNFCHDDLNLNNCIVNINKCGQTTSANSTSEDRCNSCLNIVANPIIGDGKNGNNSFIQCYLDKHSCTAFDKMADTILTYNECSHILNSHEYFNNPRCDNVQDVIFPCDDCSEKQNSTSNVDVKKKSDNYSNITTNLETCFEILQNTTCNEGKETLLPFYNFPNISDFEKCVETHNETVCDEIDCTKASNLAEYSKIQSSTVSSDRVVISNDSYVGKEGLSISSEYIFKTQHNTVCDDAAETYLSFKDCSNTPNIVDHFETHNCTVWDDVDDISALNISLKTASLEELFETQNFQVYDVAKRSTLPYILCENYLSKLSNTASDKVEEIVSAFNGCYNITNSDGSFETQKKTVHNSALNNNSTEHSEAQSSTLTDVLLGSNNINFGTPNSTVWDEGDDVIAPFNGCINTNYSEDLFEAEKDTNCYGSKLTIMPYYCTRLVLSNTNNFALLSDTDADNVIESKFQALFGNNNGTTYPKFLDVSYLKTQSHDEIYGTVIKHKGCNSHTLEDVHNTQSVIVCNEVNKSLQAFNGLNAPNWKLSGEARNSTFYNNVEDAILPCNGFSNTHDCVDGNILVTNSEYVCKINNSEHQSKLEEVVLTDNVCLDNNNFEENFKVQHVNLYKVKENIHCHDLLSNNARVEKDLEIQERVSFNNILPDVEESISIFKFFNCADNNFRSYNYYPKENEQATRETVFNQCYTNEEIIKHLGWKNCRYIPPSMYSIGTYDLNVFDHFTKPTSHLIKVFKCNLSNLKQERNLKRTHNFSRCCLKSDSLIDDFFYTMCSDKIDEINFSNDSSDGGYDSEVSVDSTTNLNTKKMGFSLPNFEEKYYSWSSDKNYFNNKIWSSYFNSIVKKYLYKTYIPHYVSPHVDLGIYLNYVNIDPSTISSNSFNNVIKIFDILNNKKGKCHRFVCRDRCECNIEHLIYTSFLNAALPDLRAISLFCDPSKLLVQNLFRDIFVKPVINGSLRFASIPNKHDITKVKNNTFLLVNLCSLGKH